MINKKLIESKLTDLKTYFEKLALLLKEDVRSIVSDDLKLPTVERRFQLIVDTAIDINTHLIKESNLATPDDYQSTFITLGENGILPMELALKIAPSVGLRNLVVHKYGQVDLKKMVEDIKSEIGQYFDYAREIDRFIKDKKDKPTSTP